MPVGARVIAVATGIRWIGWGMTEPLIPIFLFSLVGKYGTSGLIFSSGEIVFLIVLPIAGILADRYSLKPFLIGGLLFFFFDGLWVVAAFTGIASIALLADVFDGVAVASDVVGRATYLRRYTSSQRLASTIGYQTAIINSGWIVGAFISILAVRFVSLGWIFFAIIPTNLLALWVLTRYLRIDPVTRSNARTLKSSDNRYWQVWSHVLRRNDELPVLAFLMLFLNVLSGLTSFLVPIYAYTEGASLQQILVLGIIGILPETFASLFGRIADSWRGKSLPLGFAIIALSLAPLAVISFPVLFVITLVLKMVLVVLVLAIESMITTRVSFDYYGRITAVFEGLKVLGRFLGAVGLGFALDYFGKGALFPALAIATLLVGSLTWHRLAQRSVHATLSD